MDYFDEFDELAANFLLEATETEVNEHFTPFDEGGPLEGLTLQDELGWELEEYEYDLVGF